MIKLYPEIKDRVWSILLILYCFSRKRCTWYSIMMTSQSLQLTDSGRIVEFTDQLFRKRASQSILHATPTSRLTLPETIVVLYYHQSHLICWSSISYFFFFLFFFWYRDDWTNFHAPQLILWDTSHLQLTSGTRQLCLPRLGLDGKNHLVFLSLMRFELETSWPSTTSLATSIR